MAQPTLRSQELIQNHQLKSEGIALNQGPDLPMADSTFRRVKMGTWMTQSLKPLTLGFSSGHDLTVREFESCVTVSADSLRPEVCYRFFLSLSHPIPCFLSLSLSFSFFPWVSRSLSKLNKYLKK